VVRIQPAGPRARATDLSLHECPSTSSKVWAPVHARRALARLGAVEAVRPLLGVLREHFDGYWTLDDLPSALAHLGTACLDDLGACLLDADVDDDARTAASEAIKLIGRDHADARPQAIAALTAALGAGNRSRPC